MKHDKSQFTAIVHNAIKSGKGVLTTLDRHGLVDTNKSPLIFYCKDNAILHQAKNVNTRYRLENR